MVMPANPLQDIGPSRLGPLLKTGEEEEEEEKRLNN